MMDALYNWWRSLRPKEDAHPEFTNTMLEASRFADEQLQASLSKRGSDRIDWRDTSIQERFGASIPSDRRNA